MVVKMKCIQLRLIPTYQLILWYRGIGYGSNPIHDRARTYHKSLWTGYSVSLSMTIGPTAGKARQSSNSNQVSQVSLHLSSDSNNLPKAHALPSCRPRSRSSLFGSVSASHVSLPQPRDKTRPKG
ncbi:hypothetical protein V6N13_059967 [Hibiscus sabdariffa]|uniref:Uncharacterized protein n=1 Tax=Hibiscus sabdariffa TaxID=183260 RepID=A0ABR2GBB9_9ROSI